MTVNRDFSAPTNECDVRPEMPTFVGSYPNGSTHSAFWILSRWSGETPTSSA